MKNREITANESADSDGLDNKKTLARVLSVSTRTIDTWMRSKRIPFLRLSPRCIRFNRRAVLRALAAYTVREAK
jgi:excisionase family DNA binding protein